MAGKVLTVASVVVVVGLVEVVRIAVVVLIVVGQVHTVFAAENKVYRTRVYSKCWLKL